MSAWAARAGTPKPTSARWPGESSPAQAPGAPGHPDELHRLRRGVAVCSAVGSAIPLGGVDDQPPRDEPRVLSRFNHPRQVVQRRIHVRTADRFDERADHVVVLVAVAVVAHHRTVNVVAHHFPRHRAAFRHRFRRGLEIRQRTSRVASSKEDELVTRIVVKRNAPSKPPLVVHSTGEHLAHVVVERDSA